MSLSLSKISDCKVSISTFKLDKYLNSSLYYLYYSICAFLFDNSVYRLSIYSFNLNILSETSSGLSLTI